MSIQNRTIVYSTDCIKLRRIVTRKLKIAAELVKLGSFVKSIMMALYDQNGDE